LHYINTWGNFSRENSVWYREWDRATSWRRAFTDPKLGYVDNHSSDQYIAALERLRNSQRLPEGKQK